MNALRLEDYTPKMLLGWHNGGAVDWAVPKRGTTMLDPVRGYWGVGTGQWNPAFQLSDPVFGSNANAVAWWKNQSGTMLTFTTAASIAAVTALEAALRKYLPSQFAALSIDENQ